jgi:endogenous inhibitor of DNA gyrase (YacG/DUF329 family)
MSGAQTASSARTVRCPTCKGDSVYAPSNPYRPFCSERCKQIDLGAWADEGFRMAASPEPDEGLDEGSTQRLQ